MVITYDLWLERVTTSVANIFDVSAELYLSFLVAIVTIDVLNSITLSFFRNLLNLMNLTTKRFQNPKLVELVVLLCDAIENHFALENMTILIVVTTHKLGKF